MTTDAKIVAQVKRPAPETARLTAQSFALDPVCIISGKVKWHDGAEARIVAGSPVYNNPGKNTWRGEAPRGEESESSLACGGGEPPGTIGIGATGIWPTRVWPTRVWPTGVWQ